MVRKSRHPKVNLKAVIILVLVLIGLAAGVAVGYKVRKRIIADRALTAGMAAIEKQDWPEACKHLKQYLLKYPNDENILLRYAEANMSIQPLRPENISAAIAGYRRYLRNQPGNDKITDELARLYFVVGNHADCAYICRQRLNVAPDDASATLWLARALLAQRQNDEARQLLVRSVARHPEEIDAYGLLSLMAMQDGSETAIQKGFEWLNQAVENNPQSADALARRGRFNLDIRKDIAAARADMLLADSLRPENPQVRLMLAGGWLDQGELDRAEAEMQAIKQVPAERLAQYNIKTADLLFIQYKAAAILALRRDDGLRGVAIAERGLKELLDDHRVMFLPFAAELFLADHRVDDARRCVGEYRQAVEDLARQNPAIHESLALLPAAIALAEHKPYTAINLLEEVTVKQPLYPQVWRILWHAYSQTGQPRRAQAALEAYVQRRPSDRQARLELARSFRDSGRFPQALRLAEEAVQEDPRDAEAIVLKCEIVVQADKGKLTATEWAQIETDLRNLEGRQDQAGLLLALVALKHGRTNEAIAGLEKLAFEKNQVGAALRLVELHAQRGDKDKAAELCRKAIEHFPAQAAPWLQLASLRHDASEPDAVSQTLREALVQLSGEEKSKCVITLASHLFARDERNEGLTILKNHAVEHPEDVPVRLVLLGQPEIRGDPATAQSLIDELRRIEGSRGIQWRFEQARLWLAENDWRNKSEPITELLSECIKADPQWSAPVLVLGRLHEVVGRDDRAEEIYRRYFDASPQDIPVAARLLELLQRQQRFAESQQVLNRVSGDVSALSAHQIKTAIGREDFEAAIAELEKRVAADEKETASRVLLARLIYTHRKDPNAALKHLEAAAEVDPDMPAILSSRTAILHSEGRDREALELLDSVVARRHDYPSYLLRAEFHASMNQLAPAEQDYLHLPTFPDTAAEGYQKLGEFYERTGRVEEAIDAWEKGLRAAPEHRTLRINLVRALLFHPDKTNRERGREMLETALKQSPDDAGLLSIQAGMLLKEQTPTATEKALRLLEQVVQLNPGDVITHRYLIENARERGELNKASQLAARAIGANSGNVELLLLRAELEEQLNNLLSARELAQSVIRIDSKNVPARCLLARMALRRGDWDTAESLCKEAIRIAPKNELAQLIHADVLNSQDRRIEAIEHLEAYFQDSESGQAVATLLALADLYRMQKDYAKADQRLAQAESIAPAKAGVFAVRLRLLASREDYDAFINLLTAYNQNHPQDSQMLVTAASILASAGAENHIRRLQPLLDRYIAANPSQVEGYMSLAMVFYTIGDREAAVRAYRRLLELDPYHQQALNNLSWILGVEMEKTEEALPFAQKGVLRYPEDYHLLNTRGVLYYKLDMVGEARKDLEKCLAMTNEVPATQAKTLVYLGRINLKQGKATLARENFQKALTIDREHRVLANAERVELEQLVATAH